MTTSERKGALDGVRVLDLSNLYAGPMVSTILGDFGATVVKVEHPSGDNARRWGLSKNDVPLWWKFLARNKELISLDLHSPDDRNVVRELAAWADVIIENYRPGRMEQWDLGYEDLNRINPRLVMLRVTGFGQFGPMKDQPGFGTLAEAFSGFAYITGQHDGPPTLPPFGLADGVAASTGAYAVMIALYWRDTSEAGVGQFIDLSLYEPLFGILGPQVLEFDQLGVKQERYGNRSLRTAPRNAYRTKDGHWAATSAGTQQIANRIFTAIGRSELSEDPRFSNTAARLVNADAVDSVVAEWVSAHDLDAVLAAFRGAQAPVAPVYDASQIYDDPHYRERESIVQVDDPDLGPLVMQNVVPKLSLTPGAIRHTGRLQIGANQQEVIDRLGRETTTTLPDSQPWLDLLSPADRERLAAARFGRRVGFGDRCAVLVIDAQKYMVGEVGASAGEYPSACPTAPAAIAKLSVLLDKARAAGVPVFYSQFVLKADGSDAGVYARKRDLLQIDGWCLEDTPGAEIVSELGPRAGDVVFVKKKPSAFIGTPLLNMLIDRRIDTVIVTGGSTSNCVRATAVDAASLNYRTIVPSDCVFDRFEISHKVALFDIDRQYGDVVTSEDVISKMGSRVGE